MSTLPTVSQALEVLTRRNEFHEKLMLGIMGFLALFGIALLVYAAVGASGTERVVALVGGGLAEGLIFVPYSKIQDLRKQNIIIGMMAAIIDRFQDKVPAETLDDLLKGLLNAAVAR